MNHEQKQEEADRLETELAGLTEIAGFIYDQALVTYTEMVSAGGVEESNDPLVMFGRGVAHAVSAMILMQEEYEIKTGGEAARAANN